MPRLIGDHLRFRGVRKHFVVMAIITAFSPIVSTCSEARSTSEDRTHRGHTHLWSQSAHLRAKIVVNQL